MTDTISQLQTSEDHKLILASRVEHTPVSNQDGERIGHIADLSIDRQDGQVIYAIMSFGGFLGLGKRFHPLPWSMLHYEPSQGGFVVLLDREALENAPHYDAEELRDLGGPDSEPFLTKLGKYYDPYLLRT